MLQRDETFLILGAGPTGLGAAHRLQELGANNFTVLEASDQPGGLSRSYRDDRGFVWDVGGHVQFSHYDYYDKVLDRAVPRDHWFFHQRESAVWILNRFVPYPFQHNIRHLPRDVLAECLRGLVELYAKPPGRKPANLGEWIEDSFGRGIAGVFMQPYNFKVWAHPTTQLGWEWFGDRVAVVDLARILDCIIYEKDDVSWGPNNEFRFPKQGGTGAIWQAVAEQLEPERIRLETPMVRVSPAERCVETADGERHRFDHLLNTMPLDDFAQRVTGLSEESRQAASELTYSSSHILGIGLEGTAPSKLKGKCWMYFPENNCPFYRVTLFSHYSPQNVPDPAAHWSLMAEVSESRYRPVDAMTLVEDVVQGLRNTQLIDPHSRVISTWAHREEHGYPVPTVDRDAKLEILHAELEPQRICSRGRFGGWKYEVSNQDHSFMQGVEWANRVVLGIPETTYPHPATVEAGWGQQSLE